MLHSSARKLGMLVALFVMGRAPSLAAQTVLTADGVTDTYTLIRNVLGGDPIEPPDCSHTAFGPHITQAMDATLGKSVFVFHIHATPDNDRCVNFDRQRNEIKTYGPSPDYLKGFLGEIVTYRWKFKLDSGFQPSPNFTHIHQIKAGDGDSGAPIITITPREGSTDTLQIIHTDSNGTGTTLTSTALAPFRGVWVEAYEKITYATNGKYSLQLRRLDTGASLLSYTNNSIDMWRDATTFCRPKWGIYRSLNSPSFLRDEQVRFDRFCLAKGGDDCVSDSCVIATGSAWRNTAIANQTGTFTAEFDATPSASPINSVIGLSHNQQTDYTGFATLARFNPSGNIDARNGNAYAAAATIPYAAGVMYHFRLVVNVPAHTYAIFVKAPGGTERTVGSNFQFRTEQNTVTSVNWWGTFASAGSTIVCNFVIH
jgi:hypothetical protein